MEKKTALLPLPENIIFNILTQLPAQFLYNHGRFVCKTWSNIINDPMFTKAQALLSKSGLFFQYNSSESIPLFAEVKEQEIEVTEVDRFLAGKHIVGSSAGVLLLRSESFNENLYVANPVTCQILELPQLPPRGKAVGIAYMPLTGEIKVICHIVRSRTYKPCVLTVGRNMAWKPMEVKPNVTADSLMRCRNHIFSLDGVVYYTAHDLRERMMKLYANDLGDETIHHINVPRQNALEYYEIISTGKSLFLIYRPTSTPVKEATTWKLKDFKKSEWVESGWLEIEEDSSFHFFSQVGWVENSDIIFMSSRWHCPSLVDHVGTNEQNEMWIVAFDRRVGNLVGAWGGSQTSDYNLLVHNHTLISWSR